MKTALQLYSVRDTMFGDLPGHIRAIAEMGYDGAEFVDFGGDSVVRIAEEMKKNGLEVFSIHTSVGDMQAADEEKIRRYAGYGCRVIPLGWLPEERIPGGPLYRETLDIIRGYSALCAKYGIRLVYHNHDFDLRPYGDTRSLDRLLADAGEDVLGAELDTCWIYSGDADPVEYIERYGSRCPVLHLKDCVKEGGRHGFLPLGQGVIDLAPVVSAAEEKSVEWLCIEQDEPSPGKTSMECARESLEYLKKII